eukprot:6465400-Amphidinium_carterae.1
MALKGRDSNQGTIHKEVQEHLSSHDILFIASMRRHSTYVHIITKATQLCIHIPRQNNAVLPTLTLIPQVVDCFGEYM